MASSSYQRLPNPIQIRPLLRQSTKLHLSKRKRRIKLGLRGAHIKMKSYRLYKGWEMHPTRILKALKRA